MATMPNAITVVFNPKTNRLVMTAPFHLNDAIRELPSRRFDPKNKTWAVPLVAANIRAIESVKHKYNFSMSPESIAAIKNYESLTAGPVYVPFPRHLYDFGKMAPFPHQDKMLDVAWNLKAAAWFAEMGTGKTFATIHLACARFKAGLITRLVIVCPSTLRRTWVKEFAKYQTVETDIRIHDPKDKNYDKWRLTDEPGTMKVLLVSVEGLGVSENLFDSACGFVQGKSMCVSDESSRIKSPKALRTDRAIRMAANATYRLILNGTPIALGIQDLFTQYEFLDPNIMGMGDYWAFKTRYLVMGGYEDKQIVAYQNTDELMKLITPYTVEVRKKDVLKDLPEKVYKQIVIDATPKQRALFKLIAKGASADPGLQDLVIKVENTLERMLRLRQVAGGYLPRGAVIQKEVDGIMTEAIETTIEPLEENPKMDALFEMIEDHRRGAKFIIWSTFVHEIEFIRDELARRYGGDSVETYYGKTAMEDRSRIEDRYCRDSSMRFFVGNPVAAGLGLTLISGESDIMVYYSGTNAFIDRAQSEDRAHRIGQKSAVTVVDFIISKSVDEIIAASISTKKDIDQYVKDALKAGIALINILAGEQSLS
jgi:SNF2 family DNA or RNA helicase